MRIKTTMIGALVSVMMAAASVHADFYLDFNDQSAPGLTQSGWNSFVLGGDNTQTTHTYGDIMVTVYSAIDVAPASGASIQDRVRTGPTNGGGITLSDMLRDFIFADNGGEGDGMDILVEGLTPNAVYNGRIWAHDQAVVGLLLPPENNLATFITNWTANGVEIAAAFDSGSASTPTTDNEKSFAFSIAADSNGEILFEARRHADSDGSASVINGLFLTQVPEPTSSALVLAGVMGLVARRRGVRG